MRCGSDLHTELASLEIRHHAIGGGETIGAAAGETDCVDPIDEIARIERIGFTCARAAATNIDAGDRSAGHDDRRRSGLPAAPGALVVADPHAGHVGQRTMPKRICVRIHAPDRSERPGDRSRSVRQ